MRSPHLPQTLRAPTEADALLSPSSAATSPAPEHYGLAWIALAALCFSFTTISIRLSATHFGFSTSASVLLRSIAHLVLSTMLLVSFVHQSPLNLPPLYLRMLFIRGLFGTVAMVLAFKSLSYLPAGEACSIFACGPILTMILSKLVLKDTCAVHDVLCALVALLGVWLIADPSTANSNGGQHVVGALLVLVCALFSAAGYVCVRGMGTRVHFMLSVFALGIIGTPVTAFLGGREAMHQIVYNRRGTAVMLLGSLSAFCAQTCLNKGLQSSKAGQGIIMKNLEVPFVYVLALLVLGEKSSVPRILGSFLVVCAVAIVGWRSQIKS
ncbi:Solute carrier family 35 member G1 [Gracilariopsis chorda]|uniref:Solute carrier family 35 member G1 n=1 Tax=Gracilariopsis chorda TaxID=448386 RepID=A0A2V3ICQ2_9FLOR|nr:Solute carrier family 35 member G1 [Gracilariopsis chorda]|eukprot:PXF39863.1 Solute carrier family 35 member G1 [Gracilariopsis chorda]